MLNQYTNIEEIKSLQSPKRGERVTDKTAGLLSDVGNFKYELVDLAAFYGSEIHIYSGENWITGNHFVNFFPKGDPTLLPKFSDTITAQNQFDFELPMNSAVSFNLNNFLESQKISSGNYKFVINFFDTIFGNADNQYLKVDEISPDRTEIRLKAINKKSVTFLQLINQYINTINQTSIPGFLKRYLINFGRNKTFEYINSVVIGEFIYIKLANPVPENIETQFKCWLVCEKKLPYIDKFVVIPEEIESTGNNLSGPNWQAHDSSFNISSETDLKNWNELLGSSLQTSQQLIDYYFSGSLGTAKLSIDYTDFNNFVFYSSATERLVNYKYKLNLVEYYTAQSQSSSLLSGSISITNALEYDTLKSKLIGGFDDFEKFLYYESSSGLFNNEIPLENPTVSIVTGSYITPSPKSNTSVPFSLYSISSSIFETWYDNVYASASLYDQLNDNKLTRSVPEFILLDDNSEQLTLFVNMLGQHYDILYTYINAMNRINKRDEHPKLGMPNELLYSVAKQFGWNLIDGNQNKNLWEYTLGTNESGIPLTGSNSVGDPSLPSKDITYNIWRRIVNNIPGMLKSKGTKRSIQSLLSCYGIPQSLMTIQEYGGPRINRVPIYEKLNFDYALDLITTTNGTVTTDYNQVINSTELRFRLNDIIANPTMSGTYNLYNVGPAINPTSINIDFTSGTKGTLTIKNSSDTAVSNEIELFDGGWISTLLKSGSNSAGEGILNLIAHRCKDGKIVATAKAEATGSFYNSGSLVIGGVSGSTHTRLDGQVQELRLWTSSLHYQNQIGDIDNPFTNHTKAPSAYDGNTSAYDELVYRIPLTERIDHSVTGSLIGVQPVANGISSSFAAWSSNIPYDSLEETYYYDGISLGAGTFDDNKVRLEDNELIGVLDFNTRAERSQYDKAALDSKKLGVYFSPQTMINEDIIAQLGFTMLDDYIGDPGDLNARSYPDLKQRSTDYWKKYNQKNDLNAYIKIFSLFDLSFFKQLEQLLPARADKLTGLLIQPNILERNKDKVLPDASYKFDSLSDSISRIPVATGSNDEYVMNIARFLSASGNDDDQLSMFLTSSNKFDGTQYCYDELIRSGSSWKQVTSSYWKCEGVLPTITSSVKSEIYQTLYSSSAAANTTIIATTSSKVGGTEASGLDGDRVWINPIAVTSSVSASLSHPNDEEYTQYLGASRFQGLNFTSNAVVTGIEISVSKSATTSDPIDFTASLFTNSADMASTMIGNNLALPGNWSDSGMQQYTYGGPGNMWGTSLTAAEINTSGFGFAIQAFSEGECDCLVSAIELTVYYTSQSVSIFEYREAEIQDFQPIGADNHEFNGCKMTSPDFNIDSTDTIDGGPVAEIIEANPNQVVVTGGPTPTRSPSTGGGGTLTPERSAPNPNLGEETLTRSSNRNDGGNQTSKGGNLNLR